MLYTSFRLTLMEMSFFDSAMYWSSYNDESKRAHINPAYFQAFIKVIHVAEVVEELRDALLVAVDERIQRHHVHLLAVRRLIGEILQHLGNERERSSSVFGRLLVDDHVRKWSDNGRIDKAQEKEATDQGANGPTRGLGVLFLQILSITVGRKQDTLVSNLICLQIHRIPYGTWSKLAMMVFKKELAISINRSTRGARIAWTRGFAAASSVVTPRGKAGA